MDREEFQKAYGKVVAKAWEDHESEKKMQRHGRIMNPRKK